jgi:uncharacterized protein (DUF1684 family)
LFVVVSCGKEDLGNAPIPDDYEEQIREFYENRRASLTAPLGWMRLAGMYWLDAGENTFGDAPGVDVMLPEGFGLPRMGSFVLENDTVVMELADGVSVLVDEIPAGGKVVLFDGDINPMVNYGTLHWTVIQRSDLIGIRLYNTVNELADRFVAFDRYPFNLDFLVRARLVPHPEPTTVGVVNILGQLSEVNSPGRLHFSIRGEPYSLIALEGGARMFVIVGDETNRSETFQGGRYMYIDYPPEGSDITIIDFHKAYNPPCAFNAYTTCQFPPRENILPIAIRAGEKRPSPEYQAK